MSKYRKVNYINFATHGNPGNKLFKKKWGMFTYHSVNLFHALLRLQVLIQELAGVLRPRHKTVIQVAGYKWSCNTWLSTLQEVRTYSQTSGQWTLNVSTMWSDWLIGTISMMGILESESEGGERGERETIPLSMLRWLLENVYCDQAVVPILCVSYSDFLRLLWDQRVQAWLQRQSAVTMQSVPWSRSSYDEDRCRWKKKRKKGENLQQFRVNDRNHRDVDSSVNIEGKSES